MKFFEFGTEHEITLLFLCGYTADWRAAMSAIQELCKTYHVIAAPYDGFNADEPESRFVSVAYEGHKIADYLAEHFDGTIDIIYGMSLGGMVMTEILHDPRIKVHTAIADGFTIMYTPDTGSDTLNRLEAKIMANVFWSLTHKHQKLAAKIIGRTETQVKDFVYPDASKQSYFNAEYSQIGYHYKFRSFNKADSYLWHGDHEKQAIRDAQRLQTYGIRFQHKIFSGFGHGSLLHHPALLKQEIDHAYQGYDA